MSNVDLVASHQGSPAEQHMGSTRVALYIDPPTRHFLRDQLFSADDALMGGDHINARYRHLRDVCHAHGIEVHTADLMPPTPGPTRNVYISLGSLAHYRQLARRQDTILSALFVMECPIVEPSFFRGLADAQRYFKRIYSWSDGESLLPFLPRPMRFEPFRWPQSLDRVHDEVWSRSDRQFLVMINANKRPRLTYQELYTERMRAVEFFGRYGEIDLYGIGWDVPPYQMGKTWMPYTLQRAQRAIIRQWQRLRPDPLLEAARRAYRGVAATKSEVLGRYTFAICIENMILKGWITEKIFDCFYSGTVPVYLGAPDISEHIPDDCFIDMRKFGSYDDLRSSLKSLSPEAIQGYRERARAFLASPRFYPFTKDAFAKIILQIIAQDTGNLAHPDPAAARA